MSTPPSPISRPMRAVLFVMLAWIDLRAAMMLPEYSKKGAVDAPVADAVEPEGALPVFPPRVHSMSAFAHVKPEKPRLARRPDQFAANARLSTSSALVAPSSNADGDAQLFARIGQAGLAGASKPGVDRFSGSAWLLARADGANAPLANGGQLGGSQAGVRLFFQTSMPILALTARASTPLATRLGREATLGIALRGHGFGVIAEQRFALDRGGRTAPSVTAYGGVSDIAIGHGVRFDGYIQAGAVGFKRTAGFVDGAVRVEHTVVEEGHSRLSGGVSLSGGAQPGVRRVDVGPQMVARVPVGGTPVRVSAEWRQRIAGNAAPGSGPAVTVGVDF